MTAGIVSREANSGEHPGDPQIQPSSPTRIAFCITDLDVGGAERMFVELITRLDRTRWEPKVFCLAAGRLVERFTEANIPVICFGAKGIRDIGVVWKLSRELRKFQPRLIQCFLFHANLVGRFAALIARVPRIICGIRVAERRTNWPLRIDRLTQSLVDHNVCVSQAVTNFSIRDGGLDPQKVSVIPNAVDFQRFSSAQPISRAELGLDENAAVILFVGRLDRQKAPDVLLKAMQNLIEKHPDWQLLMVGDGPMRSELEQWVSDRQISRSVLFSGWRPDIPELLKTADCLALPSLWEGMPNIVLEAMAAGLPVVVSRVEGTDELIDDGVTGLLVEPGSVADLERQIETILTDESIAQRVSMNSQRLVISEFTFDRMISAYDQLYCKLLSDLSN